MEVYVTLKYPQQFGDIPEKFQELGRRTKIKERNVRLYMSTADLVVRRTQNLKGERYTFLYSIILPHQRIQHANIAYIDTIPNALKTTALG